MKPARRSAGDPSRLTASLRAAHRCVSVEIHPVFLPHAPCQPGASPASALTRVPPQAVHRVASRRSSLRFGRNTPGIPSSRALSAGRLAGLGAHAGSTTGCSPRRFAPLIVAFRSKYTRVFLPHAPRQPGASPPPGELASLGAHPGSTTGCVHFPSPPSIGPRKAWTGTRRTPAELLLRDFTNLRTPRSSAGRTVEWASPREPWSFSSRCFDSAASRPLGPAANLYPLRRLAVRAQSSRVHGNRRREGRHVELIRIQP